RMVIEKVIDIINENQVTQKIAINLSINSLLDPEFVNWFKQTMINPVLNSQLVFELDELKTTQYFDEASKFIESFTKIGCLFALDDFGSGLNSIKYISTLNLYYVKISSSLIKNIQTNIDEQFYLRTLIEAIRGLDMLVIAKGVEHLGQQEILQQYGINEFQGYLFAKPDVISEFIKNK
ncbi:MAG: EAL domain-containing protein, partial [Gammaproteobacteria bacterium]